MVGVVPFERPVHGGGARVSVLVTIRMFPRGVWLALPEHPPPWSLTLLL